MNCIFQSIYITITKILWFLVIRTLIYERSDWLSSLIFCVKEETLPSTNYRALAYTINCIAGETDSRLRNWTRFDRVSFSPRIQRGDLRFLENGLCTDSKPRKRLVKATVFWLTSWRWEVVLLLVTVILLRAEFDGWKIRKCGEWREISERNAILF